VKLLFRKTYPASSTVPLSPLASSVTTIRPVWSGINVNGVRCDIETVVQPHDASASDTTIGVDQAGTVKTALHMGGDEA
jgi:hypothetical protein